MIGCNDVRMWRQRNDLLKDIESFAGSRLRARVIPLSSQTWSYIQEATEPKLPITQV